MIVFLIAGFLLLQLNQSLPDAQSIKGVQLKVPLRIYSADNQLISEFGNERRNPVAIDDMPPTLINAVLASEDDSFYRHHGVDLMGVLRAALSNYRSGQTSQGASTITMQVARNFFLSREKTYTRKLKEMLLAVKLEQILTKNEILSLYLNKIFLGHRSYGFGAAANVYYGKPLQELNLAQFAMLAGLPKAPSAYNPLRNPERAIQRRNYVLGRLRTLELISQSDYNTAIAAPVSAKKHALATNLNAPHIAEMARAQLTEQFGEQVYWQGLNVYTTILSKQQNAAMMALRKGLQTYDKRHGFRGAVGKLDLAAFGSELQLIQQSLSSDDNNANKSADALNELFNSGTISKEWRYTLEDKLKQYPNSQEQVPAIVIASKKTQALVYTLNHASVMLNIQSSGWAKRHLTADIVSDAPTDMRKLVQTGDVIYIQPLNKPTAETQSTALETRWQLSQIPNVEGALISLEPSTGRIFSLVGGYDFFINKYNRATQSIRQPGSNIKPFIYSASLEHGFTPASVVSGAPIVITDKTNGTVWRPENYSGKFFGPTRIRKALSKSMNLVSIRLLRAIGVPAAREYLQRFGIDMSRFAPTLTMALGSGGVTPLEMLNAYAAIANGGYKIKPYFIEKITDRDGKIIYLAEQAVLCDECYLKYILTEQELAALESIEELTQQSTPASTEILAQEPTKAPTEQPDTTVAQQYEAPRVMNRANNFQTVSMLKDVVQRGTARRALALKRNDLAGKTGTTNDYVDAWFTGFNSQVATTVWVGFDEPSSMGRGEAGSRTALPIWVDYMSTALQDVPEDFSTVPEYIESVYVNRDTGKLTDQLDPDAIVEYFAINEQLPELAKLRPSSVEITEFDELNEDDLEQPSNELNPPPEQPRITDDSNSIEDLF